MDKPLISVVLPVYNEFGNLTSLTEEFRAVFAKLEIAFEIIFVDDNSSDASAAEIAAIQKQYIDIADIIYVKHHKNYGQSAAFATGFKIAKADILLTMDADGQNVPGDVPKLLHKLADGFDAVYGVRQKRSDTKIKKLSSKIGNRFRDAVTGVKVHDAGCSYRVFYKRTIIDLPLFNSLHRFLPTLWKIHGLKVGHVMVSHRQRTIGVSKYGIRNRAFKGIADCLAMRWYRKRALSGISLDLITDNTSNKIKSDNE